MNEEFPFRMRQCPSDESYQPAQNTCLPTNVATLGRRKYRQARLRNPLQMIDSRFNSSADWDNPQGDRYSVDIEIISVDLDISGNGDPLPMVEMLETTVVDHRNDKRLEGIVGNNFSSYVRDYDFSVVLQEHNKDRHEFSIPDNFGDLHGKLFKHFLNSDIYKQRFTKPPVICLSVSTSKSYSRTDNHHPIL